MIITHMPRIILCTHTYNAHTRVTTRTPAILKIFSPSRKGKPTLKWFEDMFVCISGEDQLLEMDQFAMFVHTEDVSSWKTCILHF